MLVADPGLQVYPYADDKYEDAIDLCDDTTEYALTGAMYVAGSFQIRFLILLQLCRGPSGLAVHCSSPGQKCGEFL